MTQGVEGTLSKRQRSAVCHHDPASLLESVRRGALERYLKTYDRKVRQYHIAPGYLREIQTGPSRAGPHVQQPHTRAKPEQFGNPACFATRCPAGSPIVAAENATLQIPHSSGTAEFVVPCKTFPGGGHIGLGVFIRLVRGIYDTAA
jgi:hypothetical protein